MDPITSLRDLFATRWLTAAGLAGLAYDHVLTFEDEVHLVWMAPHSFAKWAFLLNRYLVLIVQILVNCVMSGFSGIVLSDTYFATSPASQALDLYSEPDRCKHMLASFSLVAIPSIGIGNILVLQRIVILWDHRAAIVKVMMAGFLLGFGAQMIAMCFVVKRITPTVMWSPIAETCVITESNVLIVVVWGSAMIFEVLVLISTTLNALDRPRTAHEGLADVLRRDGIQYFGVITCLRIFNLVLSGFAIDRPSLIYLAAFFVWAMTSTAISRLLLNLRRVEVESGVPQISGRSSPFALQIQHRHGKGSMGGAVEIEMDIWTS